MAASKSRLDWLKRWRPGRHSRPMRLWNWWIEELADLMPLWLRQATGNANTLFVEFGNGLLVASRWQREKRMEQDRLEVPQDDPAAQINLQAQFNKIRRAGEEVVLWLPESQYLTRQVDLPLAAAEDLRQVLTFEMDRHTPFKAEQVYFDYRIVKRDVSHNKLTIKLVVAPKLTIDASFDLLTRWGAPATAIALDDSGINLMPAEQRPRQSNQLRKLNRSLILATLILGLAALFIPLLQKHALSDEIGSQLEELKRRAKATDNLRNELETLAQQHNFLIDKKMAVPAQIEVMDELSRLLPDDTWVQQFELQGKEVQIRGETGSSAKLISLLESSSNFRGASFRSSLTKGSNDKSEMFHLAAEIKERNIGKTTAPSGLTTPATALPPVVKPAS